MAWYSIFPSHLTTYETWIIRAFLILAFVNIAPWILVILYDILYYVGRRVWHEVPVWGGRARGERRPHAPSFKDRNRRMSLVEIVTGAGAGSAAQTRDGQDQTAEDARRRSSKHQKTLSSQSIEEEKEDET